MERATAMIGTRHSGQALVEHVVLWPVLILLTMAVIQGGLLYRGRVTLEHATFMAAREGSINNAWKAPMKKMLASAMAPLDIKSNPNPLTYSLAAGAANIPGTTYAENFVLPMTAGGADIEIISPSKAIFNRFAKDQYVLEPCSGRNCPGGGSFREARARVKQIPNDNLSVRPSTTVTVGSGSNVSAINIQDANLLKIRAHWCFPLQVPIVNIAIYQTLNLLSGSTAELRSCQAKTVAHNAASNNPVFYIPISAGSVVRMQSAVRCEDSACSNLGAGGVVASAGNNGTGTSPGGNTGSGNGGNNNGGGNTTPGGQPGGGVTPGGDNTGNPNGGADTPPPGGDGAGGDPPVLCNGGSNATTEPTATTAPAASPTNATNAATFTGIGNPIDIGTGNKYQREDDYAGSGVNALHFVRYYNSVLQDQDSGIGYGWRHAYQRALVIAKDHPAVTAWRDDGTQYMFKLEGDKAAAPLGVIDELAREGEGWVLITGDGSREHYDRDGQLQRIVYQSGIAHTFSYDAIGHLHRIVDSRGDRIELRWRGEHIDGVILPTRRTLRYRYDGARNFAAVRLHTTWLDALTALFNAPERAYRYEDKRFPHALTGLNNAAGDRYATWAYNNSGRAISSEHGQGVEKVSVVYRQTGNDKREVVVSNAAGLAATYTLELARPGKFRLRDVEGSAMFECAAVQNHHRYDRAGFLQKQWSADRIGNTFSRNARGLIEVEERGMRFDNDENPHAELGSTRIERVWMEERPWVLSETRLSWSLDKNKQGRWQAVTRRELTYDQRGRVRDDVLTDLTTPVSPDSSRLRRERHYSYEFADAAQTQLRTMTMTDGNRHPTIYRYEKNQLRSIENALHQRMQLDDYTAFGHAQRITLPDGQTLQVQYNDHQLPVQLTRQNTHSSVEPEITQADYDAAGRLIHLSRPDGSEQFYVYNDAGQLIQIKNNWGNTRELKPNVLNGQWEEQRIYAKGDDLMIRQQRRLNALGQLSAVLGNAGEKTEFSYSSQGDLVSASERDQDPRHPELAHTTQAKYDTQHHLLELIDAAGYATQYDYSPSGHVAAITDANHNTTTYLRNGFGDVIQQSSPITGTVIKHYDANGNLIENKSANGAPVRFNYDALNRLTIVDYPGDRDDINYTYDQIDPEHGNGVQQLTRIETQHQMIDYRYDGLGRKIAEITSAKNLDGQNTQSTALRYRYLAGNRLNEIIYPDGSAVHYRFDKDRIVEVSYTDAKKSSEHVIAKHIDYAPFGAPIAWTYGNGLRYRKQFDLSGNLQSITLNKHNEALWSQTYQYDLYHNIAQIESANRNNKTETQQFTYDKLDRLTRENSDSALKTYAYDALGNRIVSGADKQPAIEYDAAGNVAKQATANATRDYRYNRLNKPIVAHTDNRVSALYRYNALGFRTEKRSYKKGELQRTHYHYAGAGQLLSVETDESYEPILSTHYLWLGSIPLAQIEHGVGADKSPRIIYLHTDHLAAPRMATSERGSIIWRWRSDAFGNGVPDEDPDGDGQPTQIDHRFPGQIADSETGLFYNLNRYYDPARGAYTQSDPLGQLASMNTYAYVDSNPVSWFDPLGLAKLQYVLIDSFGGNPSDSSKNTLKQGTNTRMPHFAFLLTDIQGANGASLIYDPNGIETQTKNQGWYSWNSTQNGTSPWDSFLNFYRNGYGGNTAVNTGDWATISDFNDDTAAELYRKITGSYPAGYQGTEGSCPAPVEWLVPPLPKGFYAMEHFNFPTIVHKLTKPIFEASDLPDVNDVGFLNVPWFQSTFEFEGKDIPSNKNTYSRIPKKLVDKKGNAIGDSGVTLGRGFDLGRKNPATIKKLMTRIGLSSSQVNTLVGAVGHHGADHVTYFDAHKEALTAIELTREQQYLLYMYAIKDRADDAKTDRYEKDMKGNDGFAWEDLDEKIRMLMTDLNYRGDLTDANRTKLKDSVSKNDLKEVCTVISDQKYWVGIRRVPQARFEERKSIVCE
jgi:RHS repeat-associated protein